MSRWPLLDELGGIYDMPRLPGESDDWYGARLAASGLDATWPGMDDGPEPPGRCQNTHPHDGQCIDHDGHSGPCLFEANADPGGDLPA